jgi:hypothetical protein
MIDLLIASGARLDARGTDGVTAADLARQYNRDNPAIIERLQR